MIPRAVAIIIILIAAVAFFISQANDRPAPDVDSTPAITTKTSTPTPTCTGDLTPSQVAGPYYKTGSPMRTSIADPSHTGNKLLLSGYVYNTNCQPIANAQLDFWQADASGEYDNLGYKLRGHQFTDDSGRWQLDTIIPANYAARPPHLHVKVKAPNKPALTTQLYFPNQPQNQTDIIFNPAQIIAIESIDIDTNNTQAIFNFILP